LVLLHFRARSMIEMLLALSHMPVAKLSRSGITMQIFTV
jgi:hypothetical protein